MKPAMADSGTQVESELQHRLRQLPGKHLCRKGCGGPGGPQVDHKPAMGPCSKEG